MVDSYSDIYPFFDEGDYLAGYPEVAQAVKNGQFQSGLEHFILFGQFENRIATFTGTTGNDLIRGFGNSRYIFPTPYEIVSADPYDTRVIGTGAGEIDTLVGASGTDYFALAAYTVPSTPNAVQLYLGQGNNDYALVQNFQFAEDIIQLAGSPADYSQEVTNGNLYIYNKNPKDLVAIVEGMTEPLTVVDSPLFGGAFSKGTFFLGDVNYFDEADYLVSNPDVKQAVDDGVFKSAFDHYLRYGQLEGRIVTLTGTTDNDLIRGFGNSSRYIFPTPYQVVSSEPYDTRVIGTGVGELDTLIGAEGVDNFALGIYIVPSTPNAIQMYVGQGNSDYALIQNFQRGVDTIEVAGSISNFTQEIVGGSLNIYANSPSKDLVAILEGVSAPLAQVESAVFNAHEGTIYLG
ncbi:hypothetical protein [Kamptonema sp. UHCC 0994]|uniref:hypothetical protein n=1 Tax=Kamptonema sp. UHCC 0994 TaxID=3031329 RepID=UPI0023B8B9A1|nr:hypothetical protein [Kamptonema sp. UHCC 0994]MDF0555318.1 hypothetical protein [Kamptonema sp. UHCC 0994]